MNAKTFGRQIELLISDLFSGVPFGVAMWALSKEINSLLWPSVVSAILAVVVTRIVSRFVAPGSGVFQLVKMGFLTALWASGGALLMVSGLVPLSTGATLFLVLTSCAFVGLVTGISSWLLFLLFCRIRVERASI
jgi:hypothetical protein